MADTFTPTSINLCVSVCVRMPKVHLHMTGPQQICSKNFELYLYFYLQQLSVLKKV